MVLGLYRILRVMREVEVALASSPEPLPSLLLAAAGEVHVYVCVRSEVEGVYKRNHRVPMSP